MDVRDVLKSLIDGDIDISEAERQLRLDYLDSIGGDVLFDGSRQMRKNIPEVVYGASKSPETIINILDNRKGTLTLVSKVDPEKFSKINGPLDDLTYDSNAKIIISGKMPASDNGTIGIITAGTSDIPVAEEARIMAEAMGVRCVTAYDIGVAGIHRMIEPMKKMISEDVSAIVVAAGMEGALPTVISSLSPVPVIGVPVSTGYGMGGKGEAALLSILQSCSMGLTAVNIDNGIGAGATAALIAIGRR